MDSNLGALESSDLGLSNAQGFELISLTVASECSIENSLFSTFSPSPNSSKMRKLMSQKLFPKSFEFPEYFLIHALPFSHPV